MNPKPACRPLVPSGLFQQAIKVLEDRLDGLTVQFKESQPSFYNEYQSARVTVSTASARAAKVTNVVAAPGTTPVSKAA